MFEQIDGPQISTQEQLDALIKALDPGYANPPTTGGGALRVQSLDSSLKVLTFSQDHAKLWKKISKSPARSTVEEYSELSSYGTDGSSFLPTGTTPEEDDSTYQRRASYVKFMGTTRKVNHPMTLVDTFGADAITQENTNGINKIIKDVEDAMFWGDSTLGYNISTTGLEFDGLNKLITSTNRVDCAGADLTEGFIEDAALVVAEGYGTPTDLFLSAKAATNFTKGMLSKGRAIYPGAGGAAGIVAGQVVNEVATANGQVKLNPSIFLNTGRSPKKTVPSQATSTKAPTAPASIAGGAMTGSDGSFRTAQEGEIKFQATACNRYGESAPCSLSAAVTVTGSDHAKHIPLTITNAGSVVTAPEWFNIYATEVGGSTTYLIGQVAASSQANSGTTTYNYTGLILPNTSIGFMGDMSAQVIRFKQLAPIMKMDLAVTSPAYSWMILLYGVLQLYAPLQWARIINIK